MKVWGGALAGVALGLTLAGAAGSSPEYSGPDLARRLGCFACHSLRSQGGDLASPLDGIGVRLSPGELETVLSHPRRRHPGARMPSYDYLPPQDKQTLMNFLDSLK